MQETIISSNPFTIPTNCNKNNPAPAYPAIAALSVFSKEFEEMPYAEWSKRSQLAYAALYDFFTGVLNGNEEEMGSIYDSYIEENNIWDLYERYGDSGIDDFTGFDAFMMANFKDPCKVT